MPNGKRRGKGSFHFRIENDHNDDWRTRRVSFKEQGKRNRQRGFDHKFRTMGHNFLEDVEMVAQTSRKHQGRFVRKGRGSQDGRPSGRRNLMDSPSFWYRVTIHYGHKHDKEYLLKVIENYIKPVELDAIGYKVGNEESSFIVGDHKTAEAVLNADRKITLFDGWKINIRVRPITPIIEVGDELTAQIKEVLASRYNSFNKALDLSAFHTDKYFVERSVFCPLNRPNIMTAVLQIIGDSTPDLVALDLSNNKINTIDHMKIMIEKIPQLKILHLGNNKLRDIKLLDALKGLPLTEIVLDENSLCDRFRQKDAYVRAVRERFPKVIKLDHVELPPPILFVDDEVGSLPEVKASFMCDPTGASMVRTFLEQYYQIYDSGSREPLIQAYHDDAEFSFTRVCTQGDSMGAYTLGSRNLLKTDDEKRFNLLRKGKQSIVSTLKTLPETQHDPTSFAVDLVMYTPQVIQIVVMGVFKEKDKKQTIRSFSRTFIIVPVGSGFCIINELFSVQTATEDQVRKAFKQPKVEPPTGVVTSPAAPVVPIAAPDLVTKQHMIAELSSKTGMNLAWSEKCLVETNWIYDQALLAFSELHKRGTIPAEAFIKM